jgi:hypothetical protein
MSIIPKYMTFILFVIDVKKTSIPGFLFKYSLLEKALIMLNGTNGFERRETTLL